MLSALRQRLADWLRERRIRAIRMQVSAAYAAFDRAAVERLARACFAECDARSPQQIARMEKALVDSLDPHARAVFERSKETDRA